MNFAEIKTPWDIGAPQPAFKRLQRAGFIAGSVLDVGCGTGNHAIWLAALGHEAWGVDKVGPSIARARAKATEKGVRATFLVYDALALGSLERTFDTVVDSGLFHCFPDADRPKYVASLAAAVRPGGACHVLCFSDAEPYWWPRPRRIARAEIEATFGGNDRWSIERIERSEFHTLLPEHPQVSAWQASIRRVRGHDERNSA